MAEILGIDNRATVGLVVFAVFAVSTFGEKLLEWAFGVRALVAGSIGLIAGMGLVALGIARSSLPVLVAGGIVAGLGQGVSFRHGLAAINDASSGEQPGEETGNLESSVRYERRRHARASTARVG